MTKVGGDDEQVGRVGQVLAEQLPVFVLLVFTQSAHQDGHDAEVVFTAAKSDRLVLPRRNTVAVRCGKVWKFDSSRKPSV